MIAYNLKDMTIEQKLRMRVQELEDLVTEMKQQAGPTKIVELQTQLQALSLELAALQNKNKELLEFEKRRSTGPGPVNINGQDAADYYAQLLKEKDQEIAMLKKERSNQELGSRLNFGFDK